MAKYRNGTIKYTKKAHRAVANTSKDKRLSQANCVNAMCLTCQKCGTEISASQTGNQLTIRCSNHEHVGEIGGIIDHHDVLADFFDGH